MNVKIGTYVLTYVYFLTAFPIFPDIYDLGTNDIGIGRESTRPVQPPITRMLYK